MKAIGGDGEVSSTAGHGTVVRASIPIREIHRATVQRP